MAFDPVQEDCHRLVLEALRRDNIPLTDGAAVERLMEQFTRNPAPLIVHDATEPGTSLPRWSRLSTTASLLSPTTPRQSKKKPQPRTCSARQPRSIRPTGMPSAC